MGATILMLLRAFANGGTSLTGVESIADAVNIFRKPQGPNARRVLTTMACILGFLLVGVIYLVHATHATPYVAEYPSMLSEVGRAVFGQGLIGKILYGFLQTASAAILFFGANTSFNGFPALTSFVAEDSFLPRPLMKRGHRLVFSNAIITLTALAMTLVIVTGGSVDAVVPLFAMGVFTGFSMAGYGMTKHNLTHRATRLATQGGDQPLRGDLVDDRGRDLRGREVHRGRLARRRGVSDPGVRFDAAQPPISRRELRFGEFGDRTPGRGQASAASGVRLRGSLRPRVDRGAALRKRAARRQPDAVHFVIDALHASRLQQRWEHFEDEIPLRLLECPDRNLSRAAQELVMQEIDDHPGTKVTVLLPRRTYAPLVGRLLHDRTADKMAGAISRVAGATAQIVAYDVGSRIAQATAAARSQKKRRKSVERVANPRLTSSRAAEPCLLEVEVSFDGAQQCRVDAAVTPQAPVAPTARRRAVSAATRDSAPSPGHRLTPHRSAGRAAGAAPWPRTGNVQI